MKKTFFIAGICLCLGGCGIDKDSYSLVEDAYNNLIEKENLSYEVEISYDEGADKQTYVILEQGEEWTYKLYDSRDNLIHESKYEEGQAYLRLDDGEWGEQSGGNTLDFMTDVLIETDKFDEISVDTDDAGMTEISVTLNENALKEMSQELKASLEEAVTALEDMGASQQAIDAQLEHNKMQEQTVYLSDKRCYLIDENGVMVGYERITVFEQPDEEGNIVETEMINTISVSEYN